MQLLVEDNSESRRMEFQFGVFRVAMRNDVAVVVVGLKKIMVYGGRSLKVRR